MPVPTENKRPFAVTVIALVYIGVGAIGFVAHFHGLLEGSVFRFDGAAIELVELIALASGLFLLRAYNWARWLALGWIAFHVVLSAFDHWRGFAVHVLICAAIAWLLFRPDAARYFRRPAASA